MPLPVLPPHAPTAEVRAAAPECRVLSYTEAQIAYQRLRQRLPSTAFTGAQPSEICGLVRLQLAHGSVAYTDATGRYLLLALALDTYRGSPADVSSALDTAIEARTTFPQPGADSGLATKPAGGASAKREQD